MATHLSWATYLTALVAFLGIYYLAITWFYLRAEKAPVQPEVTELPSREIWMEETLSALEDVILHAQKKRYHPDEVLGALRQRMIDLKSEYGVKCKGKDPI